MKIDLRPPKGTKDFILDEARKLERVKEIIKNVFKRYGFYSLYTPAFENFSLLSAKGGLGEGVKDEIYYFKDKSNRELGLRFDLTMPLARVIASNPQLKKPFKRFCIDRVWRYDNPQKLRWREFWQADIDIVGSDSLLADAECLSAVCECMKELGIKNFYIRVNNRKLLQSIFERFVEKNKISEAFRTIDKLDKIGENGVRRELKQKGIDSKIVNIVKISGTNEIIIEKLEKNYGKLSGLVELKELLKYSKMYGIENKLKIDLSLTRGLDYYTSLVYEVFAGLKVSVGGGGRYDRLIGIFGRETPATGISLGINRLLEIVDAEKIMKPEKKVFVAFTNKNLIGDVIYICRKLRRKNIRCEYDLMNRTLKRQLEYCNKENISFVIIVGEKEIKNKKVILRDMKTGRERIIEINKLSQLKFFT